MTRATFTIAIAFLCSAAAPPVTFISPCECHDNHGEHRWAVKNDPSTPPTDASAIQAITPSDVFSWPGSVEHLTQSSERTGIENNWFALTGRVVDVKGLWPFSLRSRRRKSEDCHAVALAKADIFSACSISRASYDSASQL
jgi:hypothetical protein